MIRLAVIADTHGSNFRVLKDLRKRDIDLILHLGDHDRDIELLEDKLGLMGYAVRGNNDYGSNYPLEKNLTLEGLKITMVHGNKQGVYFTDSGLLDLAEENGSRLVLFGHTHVFTKRTVGGVTLLNPGSPSLPRDGEYSYIILEIDGGSFYINRIIL